jgi:hypothetical protein
MVKIILIKKEFFVGWNFLWNEDLVIPTKIDFFKNIEIENVFNGETSTFIKTKSKLQIKN